MLMKQYEMCELTFEGPALTENYAVIDMEAQLSCEGDSISLKGFYAGDGIYKVRFLPKKSGIYTYNVKGCITASGSVCILPGEGHGMVVAENQHFIYEDGAKYYPFGTTVYALAHQEDALVEETFSSLTNAPFNKIRLCLFPKHYDYNHNEPKHYPFEKKSDGAWDVNRPCLAFWDDFEAKMCRLGEMGIQVDLILFHPYDRWGFIQLSMEDSLVYLDYLLRRFSAYPFFWWSLANEYDLCCTDKSREDFETFEQFVADHDPYHHLLSNHNCFAPWDFSRPNITHVSYQTKTLCHVGDWYRKYGKPVMVDECCYEGNLPQLWGCLSAEEMVSRFWSAVVQGGYCTHGETYLDLENEVVWWAKGGRLKGQSPDRIAFLKDFVYSLPGPVEPVESRNEVLFFGKSEQVETLLSTMPEKTAEMIKSALNMNAVEREAFHEGEFVAKGKVDDQVFLLYLGNSRPIQYPIDLPEGHTYRVEMIDIWEKTRITVLKGVHGRIMVPLSGKPHMAIAAFAEKGGC